MESNATLVVASCKTIILNQELLVWHQKSCWHKNTNPVDAEEDTQQFAEDAEAKFGVGIFKEEGAHIFQSNSPSNHSVRNLSLFSSVN